MKIVFRQTKALEGLIDNYLDLLVEGSALLRKGIHLYLNNRSEEFEERLKLISGIESEGDKLRREIENSLYEHTLIPESRGDVLGLLESSDRVLNRKAELMVAFSVEKPEFPSEIQKLTEELTDHSASASEKMVAAIRSYFRDISAVRDHIAEVSFHESESDRIAERILRQVFESNLELSRKIHLRIFVNYIEKIADEAEDVCDRLAIAAIKRTL